MSTDESVTNLLNLWGEGDESAFDQAVHSLYQDLYQRARRAMRDERQNHTLTPTALVNEAYLRLRSVETSTWENRSKFLTFASLIMRRLLVEHARAHRSEKRGGELERIALDSEAVPALLPPADQLLDFVEALDRFRELDPRASRVVELRFFAGATEVEIADILDVGRATVQRDWRAAKRWLARELAEESH